MPRHLFTGMQPPTSPLGRIRIVTLGLLGDRETQDGMGFGARALNRLSEFIDGRHRPARLDGKPSIDLRGKPRSSDTIVG